jgi:hypothetical protein
MGEERALAAVKDMDGIEAFMITTGGEQISTEGMGFTAQ